jgi:EAL domain-containing protein (putative c-di-GMP-specific phosphodiesterase class I)
VANEPAVSEATWSHEDLESDLAGALEAGEFFLVYQPTIDLQTNAFAGVEVLIRWRHPQRGVLSPELFISELEMSGQIVPVGRWALSTACAQGAIWHDRGYRFAVSVNISTKQLGSPEFAHDVANALASSRFDPALLVLEFSQESLLGDEAATMRRLAELKTLGVRLAVDDFAPGDTPLADLAKFPIDIVKLDKGFIAGITNSPEAAALIHTLVQLAKALDVQIIASGIEDAEQRKRLAIEEVSIGQGFHFSRPHEAQEIDRYLEDFAIFSGKPL